jgi:hypothetical protein
MVQQSPVADQLCAASRRSLALAPADVLIGERLQTYAAYSDAVYQHPEFGDGSVASCGGTNVA